MFKNIFVISILIISFSCSQSEDKANSDESISENKSATVSENFEIKIERQISETDLNEQLEVMNSLLYFKKEDESSLEVKAMLKNADDILKIEEKFSNATTGSYSTNVFYIQKGKKYATKERFEERSDMNVNYCERVSFYNKKGKVVSTKIRRAQFEEDLDAQFFENAPLTDCSIQRAMDVINQEGEFETKFQGFIINKGDKFISLGSSNPNGFVSTLMLQYHNSTTKKLLKDQTKYIDKKLNVEFQKMTDQSGFEYQILLSVSE